MTILHGDRLQRWLGIAAYQIQGGKPDMPDPNPAMFRLADVTAGLGNTALQISRDQLNVDARQKDQMIALANRIASQDEARQARLEEVNKQVVGAQLESQRAQDEFSAEQRQRYRKTFQPVEDKMVRQALRSGGVGAQQRAAGRAIEDVNRSFDAAAQNQRMQMAAYGINPSAGGWLAQARQSEVDRATASAAAATQAREREKTVGWAKRADVTALGRGATSNQATSAGIALQAGSAAVGNQGQVTQSGRQGDQLQFTNLGAIGAQGQQAYQNQLAGVQQAGNLYGASAGIYGNVYDQQLRQYQLQQEYGFGNQFAKVLAGVGGAAAGAWAGGGFKTSDARIKTILGDADPDRVGACLDAIRIVRFTYKHQDETVHTGVIAQELQPIVPTAVIEGDHGPTVTAAWRVDYAALVPLLIVEVQALRRRVAQLEGV